MQTVNRKGIKTPAWLSKEQRRPLLWPALNPSHGTGLVLCAQATASKSAKMDGIVDGCVKLCEIEMEL